jgi:hypothetical protein
MARKTKKTDPETPEDRDVALVDDVIAELRLQLAVIATRREALPAGGFDRDLSAAAGQIGKVVISGAAERRAQRKASKVLNREVVMAWLRGIDENERGGIIDEAAEWDDDERPVLG